MINTKRVFYIYSYRKGRKDRNVGFVKMRNKDGNYKLSLSIKVPMGYAAEKMEICLLKKQKGQIAAYRIGTMTVPNEICKFTTIIDAAKLSEEHFEIEEIKGIYIIGAGQEKDVFFAEMGDDNREIQTWEYKEISYVC